MPADFSEYIDLIPYDLSPTDIYLGAIQLGRIVLPEFEIRQGTPDDALLQAFSYITALNVGAINRLPPRLMEGIVSLMGVNRDAGERATVTATITLNDYESFVLPVGTVLTHQRMTSSGIISTQYETLYPVSVEASDAEDELGNANPFPTVDVALAASYVGIVPSVVSGNNLQIEVVLPQVTSVVAQGDFLNGANPEDEELYLSRAKTYLESLSANIATARQIEAYVLTEFNYARRCKAYDLTNADSSLEFTAPTSAGHTAVFVWGIETALSQSRLYEILVSIANKSTAGLNFSVNNFTTVNVGVIVNAVYDQALAASSVEDAIKARLLAFLSPNGFISKSERIKVSELSNIVAQTSGIEYVNSITLVDVDNLLSEPSPIIQSDSVSGDIVFLRKGLLATSNEANFTVNLTAG